MFIIRAGEEGELSWGPAFRMGWRPASSSSIRGKRAFTSLTEEARCHLLPGRGVVVKGKCALGPFLSILVIESQRKCFCVDLCNVVDKVQIMSKGMFLILSTLF